MQQQIIDFYIPTGLAFLTVAIILLQWRKMDTAGKLLGVNFILSTVVNFAAGLYPVRNNITFAVLQFNNIADFVLTCLFFNYSVPLLREKKVLLYVGIAGTLIWAGCLIAYRNIPHAADSRFESFVSLFIIIMALISLYLMLKNTEMRVLARLPIFWLTASMLFIYGTTFVFTISFETLAKNERLFFLLEIFVMIITYVSYMADCYGFLLYSKKPRSVE